MSNGEWPGGLPLPSTGYFVIRDYFHVPLDALVEKLNARRAAALGLSDLPAAPAA